jgi:lipopolysaccharide export system protein LptA
VRFTIERLRTLLLAAGVLLVLAIAVFLALGRWKNPFNRRDLPKRLGIEIQQEANGVTYKQWHGGHTLFKIHASKVVQLKKGTATLHDVQIELYGQDGSTVDRIVGDEFEYNQKEGIATAAGPVQITLMRPNVAPAIAPKASSQQAINHKAIAAPLAGAAGTAAAGQILVKTSGLIFDQKSGVVSTSQHVDFSTIQGNGSSMGATYDSQKGHLVLDSAVELTAQRGGQPVLVHAAHAEFERGDHTSHLVTATADYRGGEATAAQATLHFREDGSVIRLDASGGFTATTSTGGHLAAPTGTLEFDAHNQPQHGHMEGGVQMDSVSQQRQTHGTAPTAEIAFTPNGQLKHVHLERGVEMHSESVQAGGKNGSAHLSRTWRSPVADVDFRDAGHGQVEAATIHGTGGVVVTSVSQSGKDPAAPSRLAADDVTGQFGPNSELTAMTGVGHARLEATNPSGAEQTATGDRIDAKFVPAAAKAAKSTQNPESQLESAELDGHVVLVQQPPAKEASKSQAPIRAAAGRATYEGAGEWLHLTQSPWVEDGGLQMTADRIDLSRASGDAFAHGNVKASWADTSSQTKPASTAAAPALGGQGPAHAISSEAVLHQNSGEATFTGQARLWQQANSVAAPVIVLNRQQQTLTAHTTNPADPVRVVLLSNGNQPGAGHASASLTASAHSTNSGPSVIRARGGDLLYSDAVHKAVLQSGVLGDVTVETDSGTSVSRQIELYLVPPAERNHAESQVERMIANGHVTLTSEDRRGTGERLKYTGATGEYVLTGTAAAPPRMTDPQRGTVTGAALIFHSRDDSVSIEGGGQKTTTDTTAPK